LGWLRGYWVGGGWLWRWWGCDLSVRSRLPRSNGQKAERRVSIWQDTWLVYPNQKSALILLLRLTGCTYCALLAAVTTLDYLAEFLLPVFSSSSSLHFQLRPACGLHECAYQAALEHTSNNYARWACKSSSTTHMHQLHATTEHYTHAPQSCPHARPHRLFRRGPCAAPRTAASRQREGST
jgi:hypothetical protein